MTAVHIETIDNRDLPVAARIVAIQRAAYAVEAGLMSFEGIPPLREDIAEVQDHTALQWLGAFEADRLVGLIAWFDRDDTIEIDRLAVDPDCARRGHGRRLVRAIPESQCTEVSTGSLNHPATALYTSEGFLPSGTTEVAAGVFTTQFRRAQ